MPALRAFLGSKSIVCSGLAAVSGLALVVAGLRAPPYKYSKAQHRQASIAA
jgi:hypothetical protein